MTTCIKIRAYKNTYKRRSTYAHNYIVCKEYNLHMRRSTYAHNYIVCKEYNLHIYKNIQGRRDPFCFFSPSYKDTCKDTYKHTYKDMPGHRRMYTDTFEQTHGEALLSHTHTHTTHRKSTIMPHIYHNNYSKAKGQKITQLLYRKVYRKLCIEKTFTV